jgi:hypothetical protein
LSFKQLVELQAAADSRWAASPSRNFGRKQCGNSFEGLVPIDRFDAHEIESDRRSALRICTRSAEEVAWRQRREVNGVLRAFKSLNERDFDDSSMVAVRI